MARILLVDDEETVLRSMGILLKGEGHTIVAIQKSDEAARLVQSESFDLLITDLRMAPVDGMQLMRLAHESHPAMPMIVISAYAADAIAEQSFATGCVAYIKKPFRIQQVIDAVRKALASSG
ncbi:MAG: hypothetical protein A2498_13950 [Lentisphaerae bacterium RIFOXYC12_FULL_60_16]|nr:MAG: hypothetical protein A2498_13950 [Lentisphaerae bacterium RIFOXYC12_FULL_60_16]